MIFGLGGLFGILVALFFANRQEIIKIEGLTDFNLETLLDVIPAGIVKDAKDITVRSFQVCNNGTRLTNTAESRA